MISTVDSPLPHQIRAAKQLARFKGGILADDMGLGKTWTSLLCIQETRSDRVLFTAPKEVTSNLKEEILKRTDIPLIDIRGATKLRRDTILNAVKTLDRFLILINLEAWSRDKELLEGLIDLQLQLIVVDEAHHLANTRTSAFKGVRELRYAVNQCPDCRDPVRPVYKCNRQDCDSGGKHNRFNYCMYCGHRQAFMYVLDCVCGSRIRNHLIKSRSVQSIVTMTGTPVLNDAKDLWPLLYLANEVKFPSADRYRKTYTEPSNQGNRLQFRPGALDLLVKEIGNQYIARSRNDAGIRLPPQTVEVLEYDRDRTRYMEQWEAYDDLEKSFAIRLEDDEIVPVTEIVVQITRMRQMLTWPMGILWRDDKGKILQQVNIEKSQKLDIVERKILEYLSCGQRIVVFSHFKAPLRELERRIGETAVTYDGDTPDSLRVKIRQDFRAAHKYPNWNVLLCNYKSTGESLTLVGATQAIVVDPEWSAGKNNQAYRRIDRIGQNEETRVHIPRIIGTVDQWMAEINLFKENMTNEFSSLSNYQSAILKAIRGEK